MLLADKRRARRGEAEAFITAAESYDSDECLLWPFGRTTGYGAYLHGMAHRESCRRAYGEPPNPDDEAAHSCGNRLCIAKRHLRWASRLENEADKRGHGRIPYGERHGNHKLSTADVLAIRAASGTHKEIAEKFGCSRENVGYIIRGDSRKFG